METCLYPEAEQCKYFASYCDSYSFLRNLMQFHSESNAISQGIYYKFPKESVTNFPRNQLQFPKESITISQGFYYNFARNQLQFPKESITIFQGIYYKFPKESITISQGIYYNFPRNQLQIPARVNIEWRKSNLNLKSLIFTKF